MRHLLKLSAVLGFLFLASPASAQIFPLPVPPGVGLETVGAPGGPARTRASRSGAEVRLCWVMWPQVRRRGVPSGLAQ
jgi:hypothetical protein